MGVTIKDVAKLANVAPSTVSRVVANNPRISEETKRRVKEAMESLGYHPNFNARSLANKSTQAIGLVMPSSAEKAFQNPFFPEVMRGISTKAHEKGFALYVSTGMTEEEIYEGVMQMVQGRRVDGIVLLYSRMDDQIQQYLLDKDFPFVVVGKPFKDADKICYVDNDNFSATQEVTQHLIDLGHERIAFVGGNPNLVMTKDRLLGYKNALDIDNILFRKEYIVHEEFLKEGGREAVAALMALEDPPTALVVVDDIMALGVIGMLSEMGVNVPEAISVASFNNVMVAELSVPPLTSVDINIYELGYQAANCLFEHIEDPSIAKEKVIVPHSIIVRSSTSACKKI
jgi:DNA-binding LacI/PurR family transcriptional regulator